MPVIMDMAQGSPEWHTARLGLPTASNFAKIVTSTGKASTSARGYMDDLLAEYLSGESADSYTNKWMDRGTELEPDARAYYEFVTDRDVQEVGFVVRDDGLCGCSPDGLVGGDGIIEIKCPSPGVHVSYLRLVALPAKYVAQVQGQLWVCGRQWCDFVSYHPSMPALIVRVERDEKLIAKIEEHVLAFAKELRIQQKMLERGVA